MKSEIIKKLHEKKNIAILTVVFAVVLTAVVVFFVYNPLQKTFDHTGFAMGSQISVVFYGEDREDISAEVFSAISALDTEKISSKNEKSEFFKLNKNGKANLTEETIGYLKKAVEICEKTDGALDITVGKLSALWDFDSAKNIVPEKAQIDKLAPFVGYEKLRFDGYSVTLGENQAVEMGALGKGIACDTAKTVFDKASIKRALITVGGTVMTYAGKDGTDDEGWNVGIRNPDMTVSDAFMKIHITETKFISTSGNYEKAFEKDGRLYHHILSSETGYPVENNLKSVTVIADTGLLSDALSTACFVLGREKSLEILKFYGADAIFTDNENKVYITESISDECTLLDESFRVLGNG